ncbi:MAG: hypothetical protein LBI18_08465 [Planctomycetaceae bacterium]|jgi:hypothetical protein|nr:hypothetical protein [Planctomycetaceae bacterium]
MTLQKQIEWNIDCKRISRFPDNQIKSRFVVINVRTGNDVVLQPWLEYIFSSQVDDKIFRLIGVLDFIEEEIKSVKLQLWNKDVQEYEFPDHPAFKELFQLVRKIEAKKNNFYVAPEVENFVDKLLQESHGLAINMQD